MRLLSERVLTRRATRLRNAASGRKRNIARHKALQPAQSPLRNDDVLFMPNQRIAYMRDRLEERTGKRFVQLLAQFMDMGTQGIAVRRKIPPDGLFKFRSGDDGRSGRSNVSKMTNPVGLKRRGTPLRVALWAAGSSSMSSQRKTLRSAAPAHGAPAHATGRPAPSSKTA